MLTHTRARAHTYILRERHTLRVNATLNDVDLKHRIFWVDIDGQLKRSSTRVGIIGVFANMLVTFNPKSHGK